MAVKPERGKCAKTAFAQQSIKAVHMVFKARMVFLFLLAISLASIALGIALLVANANIVECSISYSESDIERNRVGELVITADRCRGNMKDRNGVTYIEAPVNLYYKLNGFYQNHRRYVNSRSLDQLSGRVVTSQSDLAVCEPIIYESDGRIRHPCGLAAMSVFNDTYAVYSGANRKRVKLHDSVSDIVWPMDGRVLYKNPDSNDPNISKINQWLNEDIFPGKLENAHFAVWMRNAPLKNFQKLYAVIKEDIELPITIEVTHRYDTSKLNVAKSVKLSQTSWFGGRNLFIGVTYTTFGIIVLILVVYMYLQERRNPRVLGDVRYLQLKKKY